MPDNEVRSVGLDEGSPTGAGYLGACHHLRLIRRKYEKIRFVTTSPAVMLPIFRSEAQARILAWLLPHPDREQPIATLVPIAGTAQPNVLREVNRLLQSGLLNERRAGRARLVSANTNSPFYAPLVELLDRAYGPAELIPTALATVPGIEQVVIVGSWAHRYHGEQGPPPRDLDIVVVGTPDRRALRRANATLEDTLGLPVQIIVVTPQEWDTAPSGFLQEVQHRPHLTVLHRSAQATG